MRHAIAQLILASSLLLGALTLPMAVQASGSAGVNTIGVIADTPESLALLLQIGRGLDHVEGLRVLPIAGKGPIQTLTDLVQLPGVDAALLTSDTLGFAKSNGLLPDIDDKVSLLVRLGSLDVHVIARKGIKSFSDLDGKTIATGSTGSSSFIAAELLTSAAGLSARLFVADGLGAVAAVVGGKADAAILVGRKPLGALISAKGLHLISVAFADGLPESYSPALLSHEDYPQLIAPGQSVETLSASLVVAAFNWKRGSPQYQRTRQLTDALFAALQPGGGNDASINLAASVPGWRRHLAAEDALKSRAGKLQASSP